jgi:DNA-binding NtrC family response regulator
VIFGEAFNGDECMENIDHEGATPDFVIMDHRMPVINRIETMIDILFENPGLRIIFISADSSLRDGVLSYGAQIFMEKPFNINNLLKTIDNLT